MTAVSRTRHLTVEDLADRWNTTKNAIYALNKRGEAPPRFKRGRKLLYREADVEAHEQEHLVTP